MHTTYFLTALTIAIVTGAHAGSSRIVGGTQTVIEQYPFSASLLRLLSANNFRLRCGGSIVNNRAILTAAHCFDNEQAASWRIRVGSTNAHSGGVLHSISRIIAHPNYVRATLDSDIAILHASSAFSFNNSVRPGTIAGANYNVPDNLNVWAIGWGAIGHMGSTVEQLRHVQIRTVNQATCRNRYGEIGHSVTDNMLCSGWLDIGGRGQCQGDGGSPLLHDHVIIGVCSWGEMCAQPRYPGVNVRVSRFASWIQANA